MRTLLTFSGLAGPQGPPLPALRRLAGRPENTRFFRTTIEAVEQVLAHVGPEVHEQILPGGLRLAGWLHDVEPRPEVAAHSVVDGVLSHLYQLCLLQPPVGGPDPRGPRRPPVAAIGHSLGLLAALMAGLGVTNRRDHLTLSRYSITMATLVLLRCHQVAPTAGAGPEPARRCRQQHPGEGSPAPMAAVSGMDDGELADLVAGYNQGAGGPGVHVAITNAPGAHVLGGTAPDLADLRLSRHRRLDRARWRFLPTTAPFHTRLLEPAMELILADRVGPDYPITGERLKLPVYVSTTPHDLQQRPDVPGDVIRQTVCRPVDWPGTVRAAVAGSRPDRVVDYGPGPTARIFTRECLRAEGPALPHRTVSPVLDERKAS
jgi:malonyl CoA-acyl carrier protein transacylase